MLRLVLVVAVAALAVEGVFDEVAFFLGFANLGDYLGAAMVALTLMPWVRDAMTSN